MVGRGGALDVGSAPLETSSGSAPGADWKLHNLLVASETVRECLTTRSSKGRGILFLKISGNPAIYCWYDMCREIESLISRCITLVSVLRV